MFLSGSHSPGTTKNCLVISDGHSPRCSINNLCYYLNSDSQSETCTCYNI